MSLVAPTLPPASSTALAAAVPLQLVDSLLLPYNVGHALILGFVLGVLGTLPLKSLKATALVALSFGLLFVLTPASVMADLARPLRLTGVGLLVVAPMLFVYARS
jgi:high-affinity Fe2+/Pb2+ permease